MADERETGYANRWFLFGLILVLGLLSFLVFQPFGSYIIMALFLAYAAYPLHERLEAALGGWSRTSAFTVLFFVLALIVVPLVWMFFALVQDVTSFANQLSVQDVQHLLEQVLAAVYAYVGEPPPQPGFTSDLIASVIPTLRSYLTSRLGDIFVFLAQVLLGVFLMAFIIFYALKDGDRLVAYVRDVLPLTDRQTDELLVEVSSTVDAVFFGHIVGSVIQGILGGIGFLLFGVPNAVFWGAIMIILAIMPVVGAFLIWFPAAVVVFLLGDTTAGIGLFLWGAIVVSQVDNLVKPYLIGSRADIHPVIVLVGVLGGLAVFGVIGFILGPLVLSMFLAVLNFWRRDYLPMYVARRRIRLGDVVLEEIRDEGPPPGGGAGEGA